MKHGMCIIYSRRSGGVIIIITSFKVWQKLRGREKGWGIDVDGSQHNLNYTTYTICNNNNANEEN